MTTAEITVKKGRDYQIFRGHPWIFSGALQSSDNAEIGDIVRLVNESGEFLGFGFYEGQSIAVKIIAGAQSEPDQSYWQSRIQSAINYRKSLALPQAGITNAYRLIHGEGDGIPGLIIDIYAMVAVVEFQGAGPARLKSTWQELLTDLLPGIELILFRNEVEQQKNLTLEPVTVMENGRRIKVALDGQKTGYFLDQANNRELVKFYSANRKVLDCFCYSGGFTLAALAGNCESVVSVDSSEKALALVRENVQINFDSCLQRLTCIKADCLHWLADNKNKFDLIVLDPPAFVKHRSAVKGGLKGYQTINRLAFEALNSCGILFTLSCSQLIGPQEFEALVMEAAILAGRRARVVQHLDQAPSHAYSLSHPEGRYLKGLMLYVE